jgi:membrane fusion protein, multidrug efflux system
MSAVKRWVKTPVGPAAGLLLLGAIAWPKLQPMLSRSAAAKSSAETGAAAGTSAAKAPPAGPALRVMAITVEAILMEEKVVATGTLRADEGVELQAEVNGKIVSINFKEGTRVRRGDLLVKLNDADLHAQLTRAVFRRDLAELKERRYFELNKGGNVRQEDYDGSLNELNVQRAEVALIEAQIAKTEIRAPFDGVVGLRFVSEGTFVTPSTRIATLQSVEQVKVDFAVSEKYMNRITLGRPVSFSVAGGEQRFEGAIYAIDPRIELSTRTVLVRARGHNPQGRLLPGAFANVEFSVADIADAILIPPVAVISGVSEKNVFVFESGKAVRRAVQTGHRTETSVQITSGLKPGDRVITSGIQQLRSGAAVTIIKPQGGAVATKTLSAAGTSTGAD